MQSQRVCKECPTKSATAIFWRGGPASPLHPNGTSHQTDMAQVDFVRFTFLLGILRLRGALDQSRPAQTPRRMRGPRHRITALLDSRTTGRSGSGNKAPGSRRSKDVWMFSTDWVQSWRRPRKTPLNGAAVVFGRSEGQGVLSPRAAWRPPRQEEQTSSWFCEDSVPYPGFAHRGSPLGNLYPKRGGHGFPPTFHI